MKVYAEYFEENGIKYRRTTLLKFGDDDELIGSVVLKNPGSSEIMNPISSDDFNFIANFYTNKEIKRSNWFEFTDDPTMRFLPKLFNGYYLKKERALKGVIQLFNLYYIKDQHTESARNKLFNNDSEFLYQNAAEITLLFKNKPVYLGWFRDYKLNETIKQNAIEIFNYVKKNNAKYLNDSFYENEFYHPYYINCKYTINKSILDTIYKFDKELSK